MEHLTSKDFEGKVEKAENVVVLDFYADWCGPCRMLAPIFEELANEMDSVDFYKVNVEDASDLASRFGVRSIPTIIVFKQGEIVETLMGAMPKKNLAEVISKHA